MPIVQMPDGALVDMPDKLSAEQLAQLQQVHAKQAENQDSSWSLGNLWHKAKLAGSDLVKGALGAAASYGDAQAGTYANDNKPYQMGDAATEKLQSIGELPRKGEELQSMVTQGIGGGLAQPTSLARPILSAVAGGSSGAGAYLGHSIDPQSKVLPVIGGVAGGFLGGLGAGLAGAVRPQTAELVTQALARIEPSTLQKAHLFQVQAASKGLQMDIAQALEAVGAPNQDVTTLRNIVANSQQGTKLKGQLENQPSQLELASEGRVQQMPGRNYGLDQSSNNLGEAATEAVQAAKKRGTKLWESTYQRELEVAAAPKKQEVLDAVKALTTARGNRMAAEKTLQDHIDAVRAERIGAPAYLGEPAPNPAIAGKVDAAKAAEAAAQANLSGARQGLAAVRQVDPKVVMEQVGRLQALAAKVENTPKAAMLRDLAGSMLNKDGTPITDASNLNEILKAAVNKTKTVNLNTPGITRGESKYLESQVAETRGNFGEAFAPFREANKVFGRYQEAVVEPLRQGPVGQLAGPTGYDPVRQVPISRVVTLFERGSDPTATSSPVRTAARQLAKAGRGDDFLDAAKAYWSAKVQKSFDANPSEGPATNADAAKRLYDGLFSDKMRMQTAKDTVASVAELSGTNPVEAVRGLQNYAMIVKGMTNRPATLEGLRERGVFQIGGQNYGSDALRVFGFLPFNTAARRLEDRVLGNTFRDLDNLMATPEGVAKLAELAKAPVMSKKAITIFATIGAEMGTQPPQQQ